MEGKASASIRIKIGQYLNKLGCVFWCKLCSITSYMLVILIMCYLSYMFFWQGRLEIFCGRGRGEKEITLLGFFSVKNQNCFTIPVTQREIKHTGDSVNILNTILKFFSSILNAYDEIVFCGMQKLGVCSKSIPQHTSMDDLRSPRAKSGEWKGRQIGTGK